MSKTERLATELCDQLMLEAAAGDLKAIKKTIAMLIEYAAYETARQVDTGAALPLFRLASEFEKSFPTEFEIKKTAEP